MKENRVKSSHLLAQTERANQRPCARLRASCDRAKVLFASRKKIYPGTKPMIWFLKALQWFRRDEAFLRGSRSPKTWIWEHIAATQKMSSNRISTESLPSSLG